MSLLAIAFPLAHLLAGLPLIP
ncbi:hypothetical protein EMIT0P74_90297 [Pseudomonas sp. IT-P74]